MNRQYPYRVVLLMYSGRRESHYIKASNHRDDFDFAAFDMHMSCTADSFIDFWDDHYKNLNNDLYSLS